MPLLLTHLRTGTLAGPLNYTGVNPKINCTVPVPQPSK